MANQKSIGYRCFSKIIIFIDASFLKNDLSDINSTACANAIIFKNTGITKPPIVEGLSVDDRGRRYIVVYYLLPDYLRYFFENRLDLEVGGYHVGAFGRGHAVGPPYKTITISLQLSSHLDCRTRHDLC